MEKVKRKFLEDRLKVRQWEDIRPIYQQLKERRLVDLYCLKKWLSDWNELEGAIQEEAGWRYINMTRDTLDRLKRTVYERYVKEIAPRLDPIRHELELKALEFPMTPLLRQEDEAFDIFFRCIENNIRCFRQENIPIHTAIKLHAKQYGDIVSNMTVDIGDGEETTLPNAAAHLESTDRTHREEIYTKIIARRLQEKSTLDTLYSTIISKRDQIAKNASFTNFRDYTFTALNRFDYIAEDCFDFHKGIKEEVVPLLNEFAKERKKSLGLQQLRPWDHAVDMHNQPPLTPVKDTEDLITKTRKVLKKTDPYFGSCLRLVDHKDHLDITSRKGKAPGGYNYPLDETNVPYIFMNSASTMTDVITILHESGHAVHSLSVYKLAMNAFKHCPSEVAELASMSMELITMDHWDIYFKKDAAQLKRAKKNQLMRVISILPWIATIDAFQHWVYENPTHTIEERKKAWRKIYTDFSDSVTDWSGYEEGKDYLWQKQLHLFEVPFYYIEYGIAQLGAIAVWKNYKEAPQKCIAAYKATLELGYTKSVPAIYETAGISFDFSSGYIRTLMQFVKAEWEAL